jgi:KAP family P-loop domain
VTAIQAGAGFWFYQLQTLEESSSITERNPLPPIPLAPDNAELRDGDVVFLWAGGLQPGLKGWGIARLGSAAKASGRPAPQNAPTSFNTTITSASANRLRRPSLSVELQFGLPNVIHARRLATARGLSDAPLIRQVQTGTFFRLSAEQAFELCEFLRLDGYPAPEIAVSDVLDPIARRVERELIGIGTAVSEVLPRSPELASSAEGALRRLYSGGLLSAYEPLKAIVDSLGNVVSSAQGEKASLLAPLSAARTRLMNDVHQVARLTDAAARTRAALEAVRDTEDEWAFPPPDAQPSEPTSAPGAQPQPAPDAAEHGAIELDLDTELSPAAPARPAEEPPPAARSPDETVRRPAPPKPDSREASPKPEAREASSKPEPRQASSKAESRETSPKPHARGAPPKLEQRAASPRPMPPPAPTAAPPSAAPGSIDTSIAAPKDPLFRHWEQSDLIGIGAAVNNLARYISHEGLLPPVAIGVFGDWGSGKSFFIRALQSQIALLSSQSRDALAENRTTVFCSHIVQIEFNAWHFVESNLWASLAAHIFERLYAELERRGANEGANRNIDGLYQQFSAYKQAVAEQQRLKKLVESLAEKRDQAYAKKLAAEKSVKTRLLALTDVVKKSVKDLATEKLTASERKRLGDLLEASNVEDLDAAAEDAVAIAKEGQGLFGRIKVQWSWWGAWQFGLFAVLAALVAFGLPLLLPWILGAQADNLQKAITLLGGYVATASIALGWLARGGRKLVTAARKVESVLKDARTRVESLPDRDLDNAKREVAAAEAELVLVEQQIADQRNRLAELADEVDPNQLGTRLQAFLEARVKNDAYQKHLGLISLVRKDFSGLYELMQKYWQQRKRPVPEVLADVRDALGETAQKGVPFIERIVLYIDDLDRCPEDKVVEVLQAVHLMLGLPLFVVVVAVDVRWVGESIRKHYGKLVDDVVSASADDYLEKIFQIPYRIHPMEPDVRKLLLSGMLRQPYLSATGGTVRSQTPAIIPQELVPKEFSLYPEEQTVIEELHFIVGSSPRRVRRFLDVYRLMRAGMEEGDVQELIAKRHYAVILALFAMLSGAPRAAPRVIELLRQESLRIADEEEEGSEEHMKAFAHQTLESWHEHALREHPCPLDEKDVIRNAMLYLDALNVPRPDLLAILRRWIPEIARYSFREVRMHRL